MKSHDCFQEIDKAKNVSRATWRCSCGEDVSLMFILWWEATHDPETGELIEDGGHDIPDQS